MDWLLDLLKAIAFGIVQGITEWLPVSSTGHLILLDEFLQLELSEGFFEVFKVVIQIGSVLAVLVLYFHKLNPFSPRKNAIEKRQTFSIWGKVMIASVPAAIVGLLIDDVMEKYLSLPFVIALALIVYGVAFLWMESRKRRSAVDSLDAMPYRTALWIGAFQMLALIPGTSRSGSTILGAVILGCSRGVAAEFSFFMAIPVIVGASGLKLLKAVLENGLFGAKEMVVLVVGTLVSFLVSVVVIRFFMTFIKKHDFKPFGWYRIALGLIVILYFALSGNLFGVVAS